MNLVDLIDENGLQQDDWSLTRPKFGKEGQLEVIGWNGYVKDGNKRKKLYILSCKVCSTTDTELFGEGYFSSKKNALVNLNQIPCGCSKKPLWSKEQYVTLCSRKAKELGYTFLGFEGDRFKSYTKIRMLCDEHGEWTTGTINNLINNNQTCPECAKRVRIQKLSLNNSYTDEVFINSFLAEGHYEEGTRFERSSRITKNGLQNYWFTHCSRCGCTGESLPSRIRRGSCGCECIGGPTQAYIKLVKDCDTVVAIKFGVSKDAMSRKHNGCVFEISNFCTWQFQTRRECIRAETACKDRLVCRIISKQDMPDGWTETTYVYNLDIIKQIYKEYGGVEL